MGRSTLSRFFSRTIFPTAMAIVGLFLLLIGYIVGIDVMITSGWILVIVGAGWMLVLYRTRIYRLPVL